MRLNNTKMILAVDGGAASGKSTGAKLIARKYKLYFLSSGLLYRYASYLIIKHNPKNKILFLSKKFKKLNYGNIKNLNLHNQKISEHTAIIAKEKKIRLILRIFQKKFAKKYKNVCIEGRDIASEILKTRPRYDIAFYFSCDLNTAAYRRWKELKMFNKKISLKEVKKTLKNRNEQDKRRRYSPLKRVRDAVLIRSDILNKKEMVAKMSNEIEKKLFFKTYGRNFKNRKK